MKINLVIIVSVKIEGNERVCGVDEKGEAIERRRRRVRICVSDRESEIG
jgi:hypothetical protein